MKREKGNQNLIIEINKVYYSLLGLFVFRFPAAFLDIFLIYLHGFLLESGLFLLMCDDLR